MRTQVAIVGGGPAGLLLSHLLHLHGIGSVVLERRSQEYVQQRVRAGVLEQGTVDLLRDVGLGERMLREGEVHRGVYLQFDDERQHIPFQELTGRAITVYGQQEVVKDLNERRRRDGGQVLFEVSNVAVHDVATDRPFVRFTFDGVDHELHADFIAGCDGFHGVCRDAIPAGVRTIYERVYPFGWLGILATVGPSSDELIYANHASGFALHSMRSATLSRFYLQCAPDEPRDAWPDDRIWTELRTRLGTPGWTLHEGPIIDKVITAIRSFVAEPLRHGRLFLAGDSAHIVPPTGAKGLNLAVSDVDKLAEAIADFYRTGSATGLDCYSAACLQRVWRVQHFSWWMTSLTHHFGGPNAAFERRLQRSQFDYLRSSTAAATTLAENYVGLPTR
ncbi:4-hydroxybenzoate 3-monooxygenase [Saccharopolyspora phatthalungensis]|uniref:p-hydroxybenzoate 3-monooxygenase n=1 Tax=Saccharopolyspora phatthalungensis TaxID=664693 RepID=A0A840PX78_9PSEU|nr:4-hydroxybenzoate 3-monooxygenase [Saccharopolyspora phatthalungensis]MBB5152916.1 p-hydroxybenzoate 3-monooxygenase [Saccharopolyspora phatthalungensis]